MRFLHRLATSLSAVLTTLAAGFGLIAVATAAPTVTVTGATRNVLAPGQSATLSVSVASGESVTFQWLCKGVPISGANSATLSIASASPADSGWYLVDVTDSTGTARSKPMFVLVLPAVTQVRHWGRASQAAGGPALINDAAAIAAESYGALALRRGGAVTAWRYNDYNSLGQPNGFEASSAPSDVDNAVAVAAGGNAILLRADGTVSKWNYYAAQSSPVPGLANVVAIAASSYHGLALLSDGTVRAWLHSSSSSEAYLVNVPAGLSDVVAVAAGRYHSLALKRDGTLVTWGDNYFGQLNIPAGLANVAGISVKSATSLALKTDGAVVAWGNDYYGQATVPSDLPAAVDIASAEDHSLALTAGGALRGWGNNSNGQSTAPAGLDRIIGLAGGAGITYILRDASFDAAPAIAAPPASQQQAETLAASFSVTATGPGPLTYQWRKNSVNIPGAVSSTLTLSNLVLGDAGDYDVVVTNHIGSTTSEAATLTVNPVPVITALSAPRQMLVPGENLALEVSATGTGSLQYQWWHNGRPIPGATSPSLGTAGATWRENGYYIVTVTDTHGMRRSAPFFVTVAPAVTKVVAWGSGSYGQPSVPAGVTDAIAVATTGGTTLILRRDGTVLASGEYAFLMPVNLTDVVAIAARSHSFCALKSDGTVVSWNIFSNPAPVGLKDVVAVTATGDSMMALKSDGTIARWGTSNGSGVIPPDLAGFIGISGGQNQLFALKADGTVTSWDMESGGNPGAGNGRSPVLGLKGVAALSAGSFIHYALRNDGTVVGWGSDYLREARMPAGLKSIRAMIAGSSHGLALLENGSVIGWGDNSAGQAAVPAAASNAFAVAASGTISYALCDAGGTGAPVIVASPLATTVVEGSQAQLAVSAAGGGTLAFAWQSAPAGSATWADLTENASCQGTHTATLRLTSVPATLDGTKYRCVVTNDAGTVTSGTATLEVDPPVVITNLSPRRNVRLPGQDITLAISASGVGPLTYQWRHNGRIIPGADSSTLQREGLARQDGGSYVASVTDANGTKFSAPYFVTVAPGRTKVSAWGDEADTLQPAPVDTIDLAMGNNNFLALRRDGTVANIGNPYPQWRIPDDLGDVVSLAVGAGYSYALKGDGSIARWGIGNVGQEIIPASLSNVVALSPIGGGFAVRNDGTIAAWGWNGPQAENLTSELRDVVAIAGDAGFNHALALTADGTVYAWGGNTYGQASVPEGLTGVVAIATGTFHSLALKGDGTVVAWGINEYGESTVPAGLSGVVAITAGYRHSVALKSDGTVVAWGYDYFGQSSPPSSLGDVTEVAAGMHLSVALQSLLEITVQPGSLELVVGAPASFSVAVSVGGVTYQWRKDGVDIPGATGSAYTIAAADLTQAGAYTVVVTRGSEVITSEPGILLPRRPSSFDGQGYLARNGDVAAVIGEVVDKLERAWQHYFLYGIAEGRTDGDFNVQSYMAQYPNAGATPQAAALYWYTIGRQNGDRVPGGFDVLGYLARNADIAALFSSDKYGAWLHYYNYGLFEGRSFDANFIPAEYLELNQDLKTVFGSNLQAAVMHWFNYGHPIEDRMGRVPIGFNVDNYLARYPDLAAVFGGITPTAVRNVTVWHHYLAYGTLEGRSDGDFEAYHYLATNPDLAGIFGSDIQAAALHWYFYGRREGRRIPGGFNVQTYRSLYPDVVLVFGDDLYGSWLHYRDNGVFEGRVYDNLFRPADYLNLNPDVAAAIGTNYRDALLHWLYYGQYEGRAGRL